MFFNVLTQNNIMKTCYIKLVWYFCEMWFFNNLAWILFSAFLNAPIYVPIYFIFGDKLDLVESIFRQNAKKNKIHTAKCNTVTILGSKTWVWKTQEQFVRRINTIIMEWNFIIQHEKFVYLLQSALIYQGT